MWSSNHLRTGSLLVLVGLLGGCFKPLLAGAGGERLRSELESIRVEPIPDRMGHYLGNELSFLLGTGSANPSTQYRLQINLVQRVQTPVIDTVSGRASAASFMVDAEYKLKPISSENVIASGVAFTLISYDRTSQRYSNIRAGRDAEIKAARSLAEQIRLKLISDLSAHR